MSKTNQGAKEIQAFFNDKSELKTTARGITALLGLTGVAHEKIDVSIPGQPLQGANDLTGVLDVSVGLRPAVDGLANASSEDLMDELFEKDTSIAANPEQVQRIMNASEALKATLGGGPESAVESVLIGVAGVVLVAAISYYVLSSASEFKAQEDKDSNYNGIPDWIEAELHGDFPPKPIMHFQRALALPGDMVEQIDHAAVSLSEEKGGLLISYALNSSERAFGASLLLRA